MNFIQCLKGVISAMTEVRVHSNSTSEEPSGSRQWVRTSGTVGWTILLWRLRKVDKKFQRKWKYVQNSDFLLSRF